MDNKILNHFKKTDPILHKAALKIKKQIVIKATKDHFSKLAQSIICQQLSERVGDVIFSRFTTLFKNKKITPKNTAEFSIEKLRATGISRSKASYILDLAERIINKKLQLDKLAAMDNEAVIEELMKVKGIGPWTAEMFLMFSLGRPDIFSTGDLGLKRAIQKLYNIKDEPSQKKLLEISSKWAPYRTYACCVLWQSLDQ